METGEACGKLILLGEHAVVHGAPALVSGIDRRLCATAEPAEHSALSLLARPCDDASQPVVQAFAALMNVAPKVTARVDVRGELPPGVGLGFSAAAGVAIARAVEGVAGEIDEGRVTARATAWENVFHGNPSGVDVAAAQHGGCIRFSRADGISKVALGRPLTLAVGLSGEASSTKAMVDGVARLKRENPQLVDANIEAIRALVDNAISAAQEGQHEALGELMNLNQMLLAALMVSNETLETLCGTARAAGALGAKLTGAGGGGAVVALVEDAAAGEGVLDAWREAGFEGFLTGVGHD